MVQAGKYFAAATSYMQAGSNVMSGQYGGGWGVFIIAATSYAPTVNLVLRTGIGSTIKINSTNLAADSITPFQFPPGTYEVHMAGGSSVNVIAGIFPTS